mmetsp:Transcript_127783/g.367852  ORF Transcript_127783/g.367852 Transcript_127783/m.367852 type:complete len:231 (-) Transcript_127783:803-1495(-)
MGLHFCRRRSRRGVMLALALRRRATRRLHIRRRSRGVVLALASRCLAACRLLRLRRCFRRSILRLRGRACAPRRLVEGEVGDLIGRRRGPHKLIRRVDFRLVDGRVADLEGSFGIGRLLRRADFRLPSLPAPEAPGPPLLREFQYRGLAAHWAHLRILQPCGDATRVVDMAAGQPDHVLLSLVLRQAHAARSVLLAPPGQGVIPCGDRLCGVEHTLHQATAVGAGDVDQV